MHLSHFSSWEKVVPFNERHYEKDVVRERNVEKQWLFFYCLPPEKNISWDPLEIVQQKLMFCFPAPCC